MEILVILLLILLNGLFAMSEIALISARRSNLEMQARQGSAGARQALKLAKDPDRFLSTVQIGITLIGILTGIYSGDTLAAKFGGELARLGIPLRTATVTATRQDGTKIVFECVVRVDTPMEGDYLSSGGILPYVLDELAE